MSTVIDTPPQRPSTPPKSLGTLPHPLRGYEAHRPLRCRSNRASRKHTRKHLRNPRHESGPEATQGFPASPNNHEYHHAPNQNRTDPAAKTLQDLQRGQELFNRLLRASPGYAAPRLQTVRERNPVCEPTGRDGDR